MIWGVLQKLKITYQTPTRLVLRELPLLEWLLAFAMLLLGVIFMMMGITLTTVGSFLLAMVIVINSRSRILTFDLDDDILQIVFQYPFRRRVVNEIPFGRIQEASVQEDKSGNSQIILSTADGETGLSVFSKDVDDWKDDICEAINQLLSNRVETFSEAHERQQAEKAKNDTEGNIHETTNHQSIADSDAGSMFSNG